MIHLKLKLNRAVLVILAGCVLAGIPAGFSFAAGYSVETCRTVGGPGAGPTPVNVSSGRFTVDTSCRLGSGGHIGYRMSPSNQGSGQLATRDEWAALQWQVPSGVSMVRALPEFGGTSTNGSGRGFGAELKPWMLRTFGLGSGGLDLFGARFSVANNSAWFVPGDSPGVYGWYWGNESGGLGTPVQWGAGKAFSLDQTNGPLTPMYMPDWLAIEMADSGVSPKLRAAMPVGPYSVFRAELRCADVSCKSEGFTWVQLQGLDFTMSDPSPPVSVSAAPDAGVPGSPGDRVLRGEWLNGGLLPVRWSGSDSGTGVSAARLMIDSVATGATTEVACPGGRPGQVRNSFKPCTASASGVINMNVAQAPQGRSSLTACLEDGVSQRSCSTTITIRRDSLVPVIDAPSMELTQGGNGFRLSFVNPDHAGIVAGHRAPQARLTYSVEKRIGADFQAVVPERMTDLAGVGIEQTIGADGISLPGDGLYRVCARLRDAAGNEPQALTCTNLTVDDALPDTMILSGPASLTGETVAEFTFTSDRPADSTYHCRLDGGSWSTCESPGTFQPEGDGEHLFEVRAVLPAGTSGNSPRIDPTPATYLWAIDTSPPDTRIVSGPGPLTRGSARFTFESTEPGTFQCSLDQAQWSACTTPFVYADLDDGVHRFRVRAIDLVGNVDPSPATYEFLVDGIPPVIDVTGRPESTSDDPDAGFSWTVTDAGSTVSRCRLDGGEWSGWDGCRSPWSLEGLEPGAHTVEIQAKDEAGNVSETTVISFYVEGPPDPVPPPVPSRKYCALSEFSVRPTADGLRASLTASRYSRFVRIQFFRDTASVRRIFSADRYRELKMRAPDGPILTLKRKAIRDSRQRYVFPEVNLRTIPAWYRFRGERLIAVPRVSNEWTRCVVRYRQRLARTITGLSRWKREWGIGSRYGLNRTDRARKPAPTE